ncbi:MAG: hypothetical protein AAF488_14560, partial [Planctomycetota bacterium]
LPVLFAFLTMGNRWYEAHEWYLPAYYSLGDSDTRSDGCAVALISSVGLLLLALPFILRQLRDFQPLEPNSESAGGRTAVLDGGSSFDHPAAPDTPTVSPDTPTVDPGTAPPDLPTVDSREDDLL